MGGEGSVYEGRGWESVGAHAVSYNVKSIGICMIGDFVGKYRRINFIANIIEVKIDKSRVIPSLLISQGDSNVLRLSFVCNFYHGLTRGTPTEFRNLI